MTLTQQVYSQAVVVSGIDASEQEMLLTVLRERKFSIFCEDVVLSADLAGDRYDFID